MVAGRGGGEGAERVYESIRNTENFKLIGNEIAIKYPEWVNIALHDKNRKQKFSKNIFLLKIIKFFYEFKFLLNVYKI